MGKKRIAKKRAKQGTPKKQPKIRITKHDKEEYQRLMRNSVSKVKRIQKNWGVDVSGDIDRTKLEDFKTREQFNEWKSRQTWFTNRSNDEYQYKKNRWGVVASKRLLRQIKQDTKTAQMRIDKMEKDVQGKPFVQGGKVRGTQGERMLQMRRPTVGAFSRPNDFDFDAINTQTRLEDKARNMRRRASGEYFDERMRTMKETFMNTLEHAFNSDADKLLELLENIPPDDFYEMYMMFDEFDFDIFYPPKGQVSSHQHQIERMVGYVERYYRGEISFDLKPFRNE